MSNLKILVRGAYDIQKLRIQMGNRLVGNFKAKLGQAPSEPEDTIDVTGQVVLKQLRADYKKIYIAFCKMGKSKNLGGPRLVFFGIF